MQREWKWLSFQIYSIRPLKYIYIFLFHYFGNQNDNIYKKNSRAIVCYVSNYTEEKRSIRNRSRNLPFGLTEYFVLIEILVSWRSWGHFLFSLLVSGYRHRELTDWFGWSAGFLKCFDAFLLMISDSYWICISSWSDLFDIYHLWLFLGISIEISGKYLHLICMNNPRVLYHRSILAGWMVLYIKILFSSVVEPFFQ